MGISDSIDTFGRNEWPTWYLSPLFSDIYPLYSLKCKSYITLITDLNGSFKISDQSDIWPLLQWPFWYLSFIFNLLAKILLPQVFLMYFLWLPHYTGSNRASIRFYSNNPLWRHSLCNARIRVDSCQVLLVYFLHLLHLLRNDDSSSHSKPQHCCCIFNVLLRIVESFLWFYYSSNSKFKIYLISTFYKE